MAQHGRKNGDEALALALAVGATVEAAAQKCGLSERTVYRRLTEPDFQRLISQYRADMLSRAAAGLTAAGLEAVKTLLSLQGTQTPPAVRLGAARAVLELGARLREAGELEARLTALEQRILNEDSSTGAAP